MGDGFDRQRIAVPGWSAGVPDYEANTALTPGSKTGIGGYPRWYDEIVTQWPRVATRMGEGRAEATAMGIALHVLGATDDDPDGDETPEEAEWNDAFGSLLTSRFGLQHADGVAYGVGELMGWLYDVPWYGFGLAEPYWSEDTDAATAMRDGRVILTPLLRAAIYRWDPDYDTGRPRSVWYSGALGTRTIPYDDLLHLTHRGMPGQYYGAGELRPLIGPFSAYRSSMIAGADAMRSAKGRLLLTEPESLDAAGKARMQSLIAGFDAGRVDSFSTPYGAEREITFPTGSMPDFAGWLSSLDGIVDQLFASRTSSLGITSAGSRATAEVLSDEDSATQVSAWDRLVDRGVQALGRWLARQTGYRGRIRSASTSRPEVAEDPTQLVARLAQARQANLLGEFTLRDADALRERIGWQSLEAAGVDAASAGAPTGLLVGQIQAAIEIVGRLSPSDGSSPIAPEVARELLVAAGIPAESADRMVAASSAQPAPAPLSDPMIAPGATAPAGIIASLAEGDGHLPTSGMREEARRGLEWRREHGRGGTEVGVARARDISSGRRLSDDTVRRMVSYFARHEVDREGEGWSPGEPGYPSAGRIAWALWGGDAGRTWAEAIARRFDGSESACGCGACGVDLAESVTWAGRDGREITRYRAPLAVEVDGHTYRPELAVAWADLDDLRAVADAELAALLLPIVEEHRAATWAALQSDGYVQAEQDRIYQQYRDRYEAAILDYYQRVRTTSTEQAQAERAASEVRPTQRAGLDVEAMREWSDQQAERARLQARISAETIASRVQTPVQQASTAGQTPATFAPRQSLTGLAAEAAPIAARVEAVGTIIDAAEEAPDDMVVIAAVRTSMRDPRVCDWCRSQDGQRWYFPEDQARFLRYMDQHSLPDQSCEGRGKCRCRITLIWGRQS